MSLLGELDKMKSWSNRHAANPVVLAWIRDNPPPKDWTGTALEWAYTEMFLAPD